MLKYTGHPLVDVGLATIAAHANKAQIEDVTEDDLLAVAEYLEREYVINPLRAFLTVAFTSNAWFIQHGFNPDRTDISEEQRSEFRTTRHNFALAHLQQWNIAGDESQRCVFTGLPAATTSLSKSLQPGRAARSQIPLMLGDESINFVPNGYAGVPVSGLAMLALQIFPLGSAKAGNGVLVVHSDNTEIMQGFAYEFYHQNISNITQAKIAGADKLPAADRSLRTLLIETLIKIEQQRGVALRAEEPASITAYNLNNGKSPSLDMYQLPSEIIRFLAAATGPTHSSDWNQLVQRAWQLPPQAKKGKPEVSFTPRRNFLYEDLFALPHNAKQFIRLYFLRIPRLYGSEDDPRTRYQLRDESALVSWNLVGLFLRRILLMDETRIEQLRTLGDKLAVYVRQEGGKKFFHFFATVQRSHDFRQRLIVANERHVRNGNQPLFSFDDYIDVFEEGFETPRPDWRLARDLVLIRMIEQLRDWLNKNPDALPTDNELLLDGSAALVDSKE